MADELLVEGFEVPAALGVTKGERALRRPVSIDLVLEADLRRPGRSDRIQDTVDYMAVCETVSEVAGGREHRLLEALAQRIADAVLERHPVEACTVRVLKQAPAGYVRRAGVRIHRRRAGD